MCDPTSFVTKLGDIVSQTLPVCMPPKDQHELKPAFGRKKHSSNHPFLGFWKPVVWRKYPVSTPKDLPKTAARSTAASVLLVSLMVRAVSAFRGVRRWVGTTWWDLRVVWLLKTAWSPGFNLVPLVGSLKCL